MDPGTTVGLAVLDFNGKILLLKSKKGMGIDKVILEIERIGKPIVIATDKSDPPEMVRKLAANFGAILFSPEEDLSVEFKKEIAREYRIKDDHQRDALASAMYAYKKLKPKIEKVRAELKERENEIIARVIKGEAIARALEMEEKEKRKSVEEELKALKKEVEKSKRLIRELKKRLKQKPRVILIKELEQSKAKTLALEKEIKALEREKKKLEEELDKLGRLLKEAVTGDIDIFYKEVPSDYIVLAKVGEVFFARERSKHSEIGEEELERLIEEYRKKKVKSSN